MENVYTTASNEGLDPTGWYPGKKNGFLKNLGHVASWGLYSPDNRLATELNVQTLRARNQNQESIKHMKALHQLALENLRDYYAKSMPEKSPEEITQMAAQAYSSKFLADTEENNARGANAMVNKEKAKGLLPRAAEVATKGQLAMEAEAEASTERNRNVANNERGRARYEMDAGTRDILSQMDASGARSAEAGAQTAEFGNREAKAKAAKTFNTPFKAAQYDDMSIDSDRQKLMDENARADWIRTVESQTRPITGNTMVEDARKQAIEIQNAKLRAGAMNTLLSDPTMAKSEAAAMLNKNSLAVPYGGTVVPVVPVDQSTAIQGETRHPDVVEYGQGISPVTGLPVPIIKRKMYGTQGTNLPPSTANFDGLTGRRAPIKVDTNILNSIIGGR